MAYSKICVKTNINSFPNKNRTYIIQFLVCLCPYVCVCVYVCLYVLSIYKEFVFLLSMNSYC